MSAPILGIDTSVRGRTVCVLADLDGGLRRAIVETSVTAGAVLPYSIARLLEVSTPAAVCVAVGPGSYTAVRAGMAAGLGVAHALAIPIHGAGSLQVVAAGWAGGNGAVVTVVSDAGRGGLYLATYRLGGDRLPVEEEPPHRIAAVEWRGTRLPLVSSDAALVDAAKIDPAMALAQAAAGSARCPGPPHSGLQAVYLS